MLTQTVTARGQVTLRKEVLQHLGIGPGEKIELDLLPDGRGVMRAARQTGTMADFIKLLAGRGSKVATVEDMNAAAADSRTGCCDNDCDGSVGLAKHTVLRGRCERASGERKRFCDQDLTSFWERHGSHYRRQCACACRGVR